MKDIKNEKNGIKGKFMASVGYITLENAKKYLMDHHAKLFTLKGISTL